jgi:membrane-associated phospholipid phosphatase
MAMKTIRGKAVAWWLLAIAAVGVSFWFDDRVIAFVKGHPTPAVRSFGHYGSYFGQWHFLMIPMVIAALAAWRRRDGGLLRILCIMTIGSIIAGLGANAIRVTTGRTRPSAPPPIEQGWYGLRYHGKWIVIKADYNAFPSGHVAAAMGLIAPLLVMRRRLGWPLLAVPFLIGAARICVGAHHLSDVLAGAFFGVAVAFWVDWKITPRIPQFKLV